MVKDSISHEEAEKRAIRVKLPEKYQNEYSEKEKIYTIVNIKESIIALERDEKKYNPVIINQLFFQIEKMVVRRNDVFRTKHSSNNSIPCEQMKKLKKVFEADGQNAEVINSLIGNYIEEQTGLEAGKELTDSSESSSAEEDSQSKVWEEKIW
uniref:Uncharacterized protein n=1 Tax=Rhizophagus irregularis (strain DAOM 181602 / DAOM 197198 / MUCL 43194) TaxID=747089 RepID=U9SQ48_RHIID